MQYEWIERNENPFRWQKYKSILLAIGIANNYNDKTISKTLHTHQSIQEITHNNKKK